VLAPGDTLSMHTNAEIIRGSLLVLSAFIQRIASIRSLRDSFIHFLISSGGLAKYVDDAEVITLDALITALWLRYRASWREIMHTTDTSQISEVGGRLLNFLKEGIVGSQASELTHGIDVTDGIDENSSEITRDVTVSSDSSGTDAVHWKYQLYSAWFLTTLHPSSLPSDPSYLQSIHRIALTLLSSPNVLLSRTGLSLLGRLLLEDPPVAYLPPLDDWHLFAASLGHALTASHTSIRNNLSRGVEEMLRDMSGHAARLTMSPSRNGRSSEMFAERHAAVVANYVAWTGGDTAAVGALADACGTLSRSPPSEDQAGQQCAAAEMYAGLCRGAVMASSDADRMWKKMLPVLSHLVADMSIDAIRHWADALRFIGTGMERISDLTELVEWGVGWVERTLVRSLSKERMGQGEEKHGNGLTAADGAVKNDSFTSQSKWIAMMNSILIDIDSKAHSTPFAQTIPSEVQISDTEAFESIWMLVSDRLLPTLLDSIAHEYENCRNYIASCLYQLCDVYKKMLIASKFMAVQGNVTSKLESGMPPQTKIITAFYKFLHAESSGTEDISLVKSKLRARLTLRKFLGNCIHLGDDVEELSKLIIPLLPLAFDSLKFDTDKAIMASDDELSTLHLDVTRTFRETLAEIGNCCLVSYHQNSENLGDQEKIDDIDTILNIVSKVSKNKDWQVRQIAVHFLRCFQGGNKFMFHSSQSEVCTSIVTSLMSDERREVSSAAMAALTGILAATPIGLVSQYVHDYILKAKKSLPPKKRGRRRNSPSVSTKIIPSPPITPDASAIEAARARDQQISVFFLCAAILASPYDTPAFIPKAIEALSKHSFESFAPLNVRDTVKKCCSEFKRTHVDNWDLHRMKFNQEQLEALADVISTPHYYA